MFDEVLYVIDFVLPVLISYINSFFVEVAIWRKLRFFIILVANIVYLKNSKSDFIV